MAFRAAADEPEEPIHIIEPQEDINRDEELMPFVEPDYLPMFSFPERMRGVYITPGVDYALTDADGIRLTDGGITAGAEAALDVVQARGLNTVIINTDADGQLFYSTDVNRTVNKTDVEYMIEAAKARGLYIYLSFSVHEALRTLSEYDLQERIDNFALYVHSFTVKYPVDGIILDGYYSSKTSSALADYMGNGSGIGFDNWLLDNGAYVFALAADSIRKTSNTIPVGISVTDVWENYSEDRQDGSGTSADFEALSDGYADTLGYVKNGCVNFVFLKTEGSRNDGSVAFNDIVGWWDSHAAEAGIPLFISHANELICTEADGWGSPDELVKQVIEAEDYASYGGSAFNSLYSLEKNVMESTSVLIKHFEDTIDVAGLDSELEMTLPTQTTFKTEEPSVIFAGSFDPNFSFYFQGKPLELNEAGRFYFTVELDVGVNVFKFQSKAKVITYTITRTVNVLRSVAPSDDTIRVEEKSTVSLSAVAYKGSVVTAKINGKTVSLKEADGQSDDIDPNSNYTRYTGQYTVPEGKRGQDIDLGGITFYGTYPTKTGDINETRAGSKIIVNALVEILNDYSGSLIRINNDNTMTYNSRTTDTAPTPDMCRLPAGTLDYVVKTVTYSGTDYYITNSGKRIRTNVVTVLENKPLGSNPVSVSEVGKSGADTVIKLSMPSKAPFSIRYNNMPFTDGDNGDYYISSFSADAIVITFDYITSISSGDLKFPQSSVFTTGRWSTSESGGMTKTTLALTLRESGIYAGVTASYDSSDNLVFRFKGYKNGLQGSTIVIDPGHGYTGKSAFDPGAVGHIKEQEANLAISKYLTSIFESEGANVIRMNTESETYETETRASYARQYKPDVFLSIHCNAAANSGANGGEAYYFTPYSQPLAKYISSALGNYLSDQVHGGGNYNRGEKYNYFFVTQQQEFPSVLVETAFVTNYDEAMALANSTHLKGFANAIASGVKKFLSRSGYSPYGDGSGTIEQGSGVPQPPPEETPPETEPLTPGDIETTDPFDNPDSSDNPDENPWDFGDDPFGLGGNPFDADGGKDPEWNFGGSGGFYGW